jgi:hypothetical protein
VIFEGQSYIFSINMQDRVVGSIAATFLHWNHLPPSPYLSTFISGNELSDLDPITAIDPDSPIELKDVSGLWRGSGSRSS